MRILYKNDDGMLQVVHPSLELIEIMSDKEIADLLVPAGKHYKIIDESELPDRSQRNQWDVDEAELNDGVGR